MVWAKQFVVLQEHLSNKFIILLFVEFNKTKFFWLLNWIVFVQSCALWADEEAICFIGIVTPEVHVVHGLVDCALSELGGVVFCINDHLQLLPLWSQEFRLALDRRFIGLQQFSIRPTLFSIVSDLSPNLIKLPPVNRISLWFARIQLKLHILNHSDLT